MKRFRKINEIKSKIGWIDKKTDGVAYLDDKKFIVNLYLWTYDTIVHEALHINYPTWSEQEVRDMTKKIIKETPRKTIIKTAKEYLKNKLKT